jgi:hypothetical protein
MPQIPLEIVRERGQFLGGYCPPAKSVWALHASLATRMPEVLLNFVPEQEQLLSCLRVEKR